MPTPLFFFLSQSWKHSSQFTWVSVHSSASWSWRASLDSLQLNIYPMNIFQSREDFDFFNHSHILRILGSRASSSRKLDSNLSIPIHIVNPQTTAHLSIPIFSQVCIQGTPSPQNSAHLRICSFICSLGLSSRESDSTVRWLDLEAGLHEVDGEFLREERLVIEYQVLSFKFQ